MKKPIRVIIYATEDYTTNSLLYGCYTQIKKRSELLALFEGQIAPGVYDEDSDIFIADDSFESLKDLVKVLQKGISEYPVISNIKFFFDFPDHLNVGFWQKDKESSYTVVENSLTRERPLNESEKQQFARAFISLSEDK